MNEITDLTVAQIRPFSVDTIPLNVITSKSSVENIRNNLNFTQIELAPPTDGKEAIVFSRGELKTKGKTTIINRIIVEPRRIIVDVLGSSKDANDVYSFFVALLKNETGRNFDKLLAPLLLTEMTQCVVSLDFSFTSLFNKGFLKFLNKNIKDSATNSTAEATVFPSSIDIEISFRVLDKALLDNKITISNKKMIIAPRKGIPLEAKRYYTSSPFNSDTHLEMLKALEELVAKP